MVSLKRPSSVGGGGNSSSLNREGLGSIFDIDERGGGGGGDGDDGGDGYRSGRLLATTGVLSREKCEVGLRLLFNGIPPSLGA